MSRNPPGENFDISTYEYEDIDIERVVKNLPSQLSSVITLALMGHTSAEIGRFLGISRRWVTKLKADAMTELRFALRGSPTSGIYRHNAI